MKRRNRESQNKKHNFILKKSKKQEVNVVFVSENICFPHDDVCVEDRASWR